MLLQAVFCCLLVSLVTSAGPPQPPTQPPTVVPENIKDPVAFIRVILAYRMGEKMDFSALNQKFHFNSMMTVSEGEITGWKTMQVRNAKVTPIAINSSPISINDSPPKPTGKPTFKPNEPPPIPDSDEVITGETPVEVEFDLYFDDLSVNYDKFVARTLKFFTASGKWTARNIKNAFKVIVTLHPRDNSGKECLTEVKHISILAGAIDKYSIACRTCFWMMIPRRAKDELRDKIQSALTLNMYVLVVRSLSNMPLLNFYDSCSHYAR